MDRDHAAEQLTSARRAATAGAIPRLAPWVPVVAGVLVAAAVALAGWASPDIGWRLAELGGAVLAAGAAVLVVRAARRRRGVRGLRGLARDQWLGCLVSAIALFVVALDASTELRPVYTGLGVVAGLATAVLLYRRGSCW